ncbi:MAG: hypothetical protein LAO31_20060 [Acidobacteriia bacterium]|nr:hypothetical protein [Terriglobia bacterium]
MKDFSSFRIEDYVSMFWRRKWYAIVTAVVITAAGVLYALHMPAIYRSETTILVQAQGISEGYVKPTDTSRPEDRLAVISQEINSRSLLESIIRDFKLFGYGQDGTISMDQALSWMRGQIEIRLGSVNTFTVAYYARRPTLARDVTKRLANDMMRTRTSSREEQANVTDQFLDDQLRQTERDLATQETRLKIFKTQNLGALPEQNSANLAAMNGLHNQLIANESAIQRAQDQQLILEQRLVDVKRMDSFSQEVISKVGGKNGSGPVSSNSRAGLLAQLESKRKDLADLSLKYTDKFPDVVRLRREVQDLEQQISRLPAPVEGEGDSTQGSTSTASSAGTDSDTSAVKSQLAILKRDIAARQKEHEDILQQIRIYQGRLNLSPRIEQELLSINRDYEAAKEHYRSLQDKKFNAQVSANLEKSNKNEVFKVLEEANLPETPVKPNRRQVALMGLFAGVVCGLGLVFGIEFLDPTLGDEAIAGAQLKLPVLISLPEIREDDRAVTRAAERGTRLARRA